MPPVQVVTLNGTEIRVEVFRKREPVRSGESDYSFDLTTLRSTLQTQKRGWDALTVELSLAEETALYALLGPQGLVTLSGDCVGGAEIPVEVLAGATDYIGGDGQLYRKVALGIREA